MCYAVLHSYICYQNTFLILRLVSIIGLEPQSALTGPVFITVKRILLSFKYCLKVAIQRIIVEGSALHVALCVDSFVVRITVRGLVKFEIF